MNLLHESSSCSSRRSNRLFTAFTHSDFYTQTTRRFLGGQLLYLFRRAGFSNQEYSMTLLACIGYARWIISLTYDDGEKAKMGFISDQKIFSYGMAFVGAGSELRLTT